MKILFLNKFNQKEVKEMDNIPRLGDTIPLFYQPFPKVKDVIWFPGKVDSNFSNFDIVIIVE